MVIYKTTNLVNGKIYIGQDSKNNPNYYGSGKILKKAIKKYGKDNFIKEIILECKTQEELDIMEKLWISKLNSTNKNIGYNVSFGGQSGNMSGLKHSDITKLKYSENRKGKLSGDKNPMYGKKHSEESRKKMSENAKKRNNSPTSKKVKVGELLFNSASEAAKHFNISNSLASYRCRNNFKDWSWY